MGEKMSRQQREKIDAMLRQLRREGPPPSVEELRAGFAALMSTMIVPPGFCTSVTTLGGRPALSVVPDQGARRDQLARPGQHRGMLHRGLPVRDTDAPLA
jgi:hypothetical protein